MNEANKNEVDLLLRSYARGHRETASSSQQSLAAEHLDADELNSFAEGVVTPAARARYMEHLADCAACRGMVVNLTQATGAVAAFDAAPQKSTSGFWHSVSLFFSSPVLRFAVPVLVLTVVIGIGLIVFRQQRQTELVAQNQHGDSTAPPSGVAPSQPTVAVEPSPAAVAGARPQPSLETPESPKNPSEDKKIAVTEVPVASDSTLAKAAEGQDSGEAVPGAGAGILAKAQPSDAPSKAAAPPPDEALKSGEFAGESIAKREEQELRRDKYKSKDDEDIHGPNRARNAPMPMSQRAADGVITRGGPSAQNKNQANQANQANEVETRIVLGKRFARSGPGWVDTEYGSQATFRLTRGSEQYRALIADEPGIRTIAERLDGVVIVVWKGRAYRIQ